MPFALFSTSIGACGVAWGAAGIIAVRLPDASPDATRAHLAPRGDETTPPVHVSEAIGAMRRHLAGDVQDLAAFDVDLAGLPPFHTRIYEALRRVPAGSTVGYAELAARAGSPQASRAVGQAMAKNPLPLLVPCHRVLAAGGKPGGFSAFGGASLKARLLALEGVRIGPRSLSLFDGDASSPLDGAARALTEADPRLGRVIAKVGPLGLKVATMQSPFEALAESIVYQQLTGKAAATILARVHALFGPREAFTPEAVLAIAPDTLRAAGLSNAKTLALRDLAARVLDGTVPPLDALATLGEDEIVRRLTTIRAIGRCSVEMLLIFRLGWPDVLPTTDYGVRKGFAAAFGLRELPSPADVAKRGERWRPYRSAASWYLWRASEAATA